MKGPGLSELLDEVTSQADFAAIVGISEAAVSGMVADGILTRGDTAHEWIMAYCDRLREVAAGRAAEGGIDLATERALLAREQRLGIEIKNALLRGEYAPIRLLAEVLASASQGVSERFEQLPGMLKKSCPGLPVETLALIVATITAAKNEWARATAALIAADLTADDLEADPTDVGDA